MHDDHSHIGEHTHNHAHHSEEETLTLLTYMLDHNRHHAEDLHEIYHSLEDAGKTEAAQALHDAMHLFGDANDKLEEALKLIK